MIRLQSVSKRFGDGTVAVASLDLDVPEGALVALVGPSGCGKTTTLKMVNRLVQPTSGRIVLGGEDVTHVDQVQLRRRIGYVIQTTGLFPHRTILENVTTVPQLLGWDRARTRARGLELLELVGLDPGTYARRYPDQLSGGQRQRVGVARALAADPPVLLMDEPFGAVDPVVRARLQSEFLRLQQEVRKTILLVTHDLDEAVRLGDRIAVLSQGGRLEQYDTPAAVLGSPASDAVADFVGSDRMLRRLSVTPVDPRDLAQPPVLHLDEPLAAAAERLRSASRPWGVVLDRSGRLHGWLPLCAARTLDPAGTVGGAAQRVPASVPVTATLAQAFGELLGHDAGWVAVLDGDRCLGALTAETLHAALRRPLRADGAPAAVPDGERLRRADG
ncbi:MAG: ATP-binding cassette domain-containing protein [Actinomycetota bacterium]|nr:ATP-binding cassette domain-containing protein [Actinomycetota bacterium]